MPTENQKQFATPSDCLKVVENIEQAGALRSRDRALINGQFNGARPYTDQEVEENQIQVNVNQLGGYRMAMDANSQVNGALLNKDRFFSVRCVGGNSEKQEEWGQIFTRNIHLPLKRGRSGKKHLFTLKNRNASLTLHGIGALLWTTSNKWLPKFVSLDDLLIPTDATVEFSDELGHFGVNIYMTPWQLRKLTSGEKVDKGWNLKFANRILTSIPKAAQFSPDTLNRPEQFESLWKQHAMFMNSDAVPKIKLTFFFYQDPDSGKWFRKVLYRVTDGINIPQTENTEFLYDSSVPFADYIEQIIHVQIGDGNVVAPLKFHSVRGLGILMFAIVELDNRMYCQTMQHIMEQLMALLRIQDPVGKDRPKVINLKPYGVLEEGVSFVRPEERNQADIRMVEFGMARNRQLMAEGSSSYVQDVDTGTRREQTFGEAQIKLQTANKIVSGMLSNMYLQENFYYEEVVRRFLKQNSGDKDIQSFQEKCIAEGIPSDVLFEYENWELDVEKVFGMGDQTLAIQEVNSLMGIASQLEPTAQRIVRRMYVATITRNYDLARKLVPEDQVVGSAGRQAAEDVFATLMRGIPVSLREGIEQQDYVIAMVEMMAQEVARIQTADNVGTPQDIAGLQTVAQDIEQHLNILAQDPAMKELVAGVGKSIGKIMNEVKAFAQRQEDAKNASSEKQDPEAIAKIQTEIMQSQSKIAMQQEQAQAKLEMQAQKHEQQLRQAEERHQQQIVAQYQQAQAQVQSEQARTASSILSEREKTASQIETSEAKAAASASARPVESGSKPKQKEQKERPINIVVNVPKPGRSKVVIERDDKGKIIGAIKEE